MIKFNLKNDSCMKIVILLCLCFEKQKIMLVAICI